MTMNEQVRCTATLQFYYEVAVQHIVQVIRDVRKCLELSLSLTDGGPKRGGSKASHIGI